MTATTLYFAFPGDLDTPTGGYQYDRRLISSLRELGLDLRPLSLPSGFPRAGQAELERARQILAALPDGALIIIDGLAFGVMDELARSEAQRLRFIALCHHPLALESGLDTARKQSFLESETRALACARAVIVTSGHTGQILESQFSVPRERITVALPGTDQTPFARCEGETLRLLTVASLTPRKAHDVLIEALGRLVCLPWQARFVGSPEFDPDWSRKLRKQVNRLQLQDRIRFVGTVDKLQSEYQRADAFVLPSRFEGYGMVYAEAMAAGLPVIAARSGAVPDVVPADAGLLVPPDDDKSLAEALRRLMTDKALRRQLQRGAQRAASNLPTWLDSARRVARLVAEVEKT